MTAPRTDTERLDWLTRQGNGQPWIARQSEVGRGFRLHNSEHRADTHPDPRAAIDAAMSAERAP